MEKEKVSLNVSKDGLSSNPLCTSHDYVPERRSKMIRWGQGQIHIRGNTILYCAGNYLN